MDNHYPYCSLFGFTQEVIDLRLQLMDLGQAQQAISGQFLEEIIRPSLIRIVDDFYVQLLQMPEFLHIVHKGGSNVEDLKKTQTHYLSTLGEDFTSPDYFDARLRVGWAHFHVGVPLSLYQSAYRALQEILVQLIIEQIDDKHHRQAMISYALKISTLDMSLAVTAYHHSKVNDLEDSIRNIQYDRLQLMQKANTDALTGLANREVIRKRLSKEMLNLCKDDYEIHLIMADLDYFKKINDQYGHVTGDYVLKGVAQRIRQSLRGTDIVGRFGGEEFVVLLINKDQDQAEQIAERIRAHVAEAPFNANGQQVNVTISQGLTCATIDDTVETLIERADQALYQAKRSGRNCVVVARC